MAPDDDLTCVFRFFTEVGIIQQLISTKLESYLPGRMSATQFGLLGHLERRPDGETPLQLAQAFQVPKTSMSHMLAGLEGHGFVVLSPNPDDKRSKIARITEPGRAFQRDISQTLQQALAPTLKDLGIAPFAQALPELEKVRQALDTERDAP
ncbi:MarR family winged helix-turn-helix transcriptional regulator [Primorskyibacter sp. S187A]|uniref:MarR family winged helix-turn-helix transcriptional regulator n=1 Tax=Primorskyibacter sp. S187A TaxID=3415130 RepID=UPI003C7D277B